MYGSGALFNEARALVGSKSSFTGRREAIIGGLSSSFLDRWVATRDSHVAIQLLLLNVNLSVDIVS